MEALWPAFDSYLRENETVSADIGLVSGKNVLERVENSSNLGRYSVEGCPLNTLYKYVCANSSNNIYPWYRQWKDTIEVKGFMVTKIRIRWTKTSYDPSISDDPYFDFG